MLNLSLQLAWLLVNLVLKNTGSIERQYFYIAFIQNQTTQFGQIPLAEKYALRFVAVFSHCIDVKPNNSKTAVTFGQLSLTEILLYLLAQ